MSVHAASTCTSAVCCEVPRRRCTSACSAEAGRKRLLLSSAPLGWGFLWHHPPSGLVFLLPVSMFWWVPAPAEGRDGAGEPARVLVSAPSCTPRCARAHGAWGAQTPRRIPVPLGAAQAPPEAAAGRTGCLRPRGWHRAPRAGEVPAFLVRLQVEQWAGARGGDAAALSVHPCVSALGHPWDTPSHTPCCPTSPPEPHTGIAPRPWHRLGFSRTPAGCQPCPHPPCKQDGADTLGLCPGGALTA